MNPCIKERKLNFDHDGRYLPCPICQTETKNWNCHILYLAGDSIYNLFQKVSTEYTIVKNLKNGIICPNPKCGAGFESDIDYIGASIKCPECELLNSIGYRARDHVKFKSKTVVSSGHGFAARKSNLEVRTYSRTNFKVNIIFVQSVKWLRIL